MLLNRPSALLACAWLGNLVAGAAFPQPIPVPGPEVNSTGLEKREDNGAYCWKYIRQPSYPYPVYFRLETWGPWDDDWGHGLLDNLRGKCGEDGGNVYQWGFGYKPGPPPTNGWATFEFAGTDVWWSHCVEDAVWEASNFKGQAIWNMNCNPSNKWW